MPFSLGCSEAENVFEGRVERVDLRGAQPADRVAEACDVDGPQLLDQNARVPVVDRDRRP